MKNELCEIKEYFIKKSLFNASVAFSHSVFTEIKTSAKISQSLEQITHALLESCLKLILKLDLPTKRTNQLLYKNGIFFNM